MLILKRFRLISMAFLLLAGCSARNATPTSSSPWIEETVTFTSGANQLEGILTLPNIPSPYPAIVLISGSADEGTGLRPGVADLYHIRQAHNMVNAGFAILRYDPPGVGNSTGDSRYESMDDRAQEALAALNYLQSLKDICPDRVGLWGVSQGGWVIQMVAAENPQDVAFIISVSGSGVSIAEQQVWGVETQSRAAGLSESDVAKAVLLIRLLIDWQLSNPIYQAANEASAATLGDGPWQDFLKLVYEPDKRTRYESIQTVINILETIQDEPWTQALYLRKLWLPNLRGISPEQAAALQGDDSHGLLTDPKDFLPRVTAPVLAFFGEDDQLVPARKSAELYEQYLMQAGNKNFKIVVFPDADHGLNGATVEYWKILFEWLDEL
jgi:pimeloyl-ACP methyl ester carboxylesterase